MFTFISVLVDELQHLYPQGFLDQCQNYNANKSQLPFGLEI